MKRWRQDNFRNHHCATYACGAIYEGDDGLYDLVAGDGICCLNALSACLLP